MAGKNQIDMTNGPIFGKLLQFSIPLICSGILQLLFNAADMVIVGKFCGDNSLAAVGSTNSLVNLLVNLFVGLSVGANVTAAGYFGAGEKDKIHETVHTAMLLSVISGVILTVAGMTLARHILVWMKAPENVIGLSTIYLEIYFAGITATMIYNFGSALLRAKGDTKRPLFILFAAGLLNVVLNLFFVIVVDMNVAGVALATVISQSLAAVLVVLCLMRETGDFKLELKKLHLNGTILAKIIQIGVPAGLQGIMFSLSNVIIQSTINSFGEVVVAGNSAGSSIEGFVYVSMNGFSQGTLTFVSQNMGAGKIDRIKKVIITALLTIAVVGEAFGCTVYIFGPQLMGFYTDSPEVVKAGMERIGIICTTYALCGIMDVMGNSIRGLGHSMLPMLVTLAGACLSRIVWIFTVVSIPKYHSTKVLFLSYPLSWILTFCVHVLCFLIIFIPMERKWKAENAASSLKTTC